MRIVLALLLLSSCTTVIRHGVILNDRDLSSMHIGLTRVEDVHTILGSPSFEWKGKWYYASTVKKYRAFFLPTIKEHDVHEITFSEGTVSNIRHFTRKDINSVSVPLCTIKTEKPDLTKMFK